MRIKEVAAGSGLSVETLRYYERIGLLPPPVRDASGHRVYQDRDLAWLHFVLRLRATGMPIADMLRYAALRAGGAETAPARRALLVAHRERVAARLTALAAGLDAVDHKIAWYDNQQRSEDVGQD